MRFGKYFEIILNNKWLFLCRNILYMYILIIDARICWGVQGHTLVPLVKFLKCGAVWCVLKYILIRLCIEKFPKKLKYFYIKHIFFI